MKKLLILGGTKFVGLKLLNLLNDENIDYYVASRKRIKVEHFIFFDRKNIYDLNKLFSEHNFDVIIDFISYSSLDSKILIDSLKYNKRKPKLIVISSTYVYSDPKRLSSNSLFSENEFEAKSFSYHLKDRPDINYSDGKREMESYLINNYYNKKLVILRFPIILGFNDHTKRTHFYFNRIINNKCYNPENINSISNYIFPFEACLSIKNFILNENFGTFNVASNDVSEYNLISIYCNYLKISINNFIDKKLKINESPFYLPFDFKIDSSKYNSIFNQKFNFENSLIRELSKIKN